MSAYATLTGVFTHKGKTTVSAAADAPVADDRRGFNAIRRTFGQVIT